MSYASLVAVGRSVWWGQLSIDVGQIKIKLRSRVCTAGVEVLVRSLLSVHLFTFLVSHNHVRWLYICCGVDRCALYKQLDASRHNHCCCVGSFRPSPSAAPVLTLGQKGSPDPRGQTRNSITDTR